MPKTRYAFFVKRATCPQRLAFPLAERWVKSVHWGIVCQPTDREEITAKLYATRPPATLGEGGNAYTIMRLTLSNSQSS